MKILVIGDHCSDQYAYCDISRLCPEAPVPVLQFKYSVSTPGMAGNVSRNLECLNAIVELKCNKENITKTRYVDEYSSQMVMRLDENDTCSRIHQPWIDYFIEKQKWKNYDAIIISDYDKGFLLTDDIERICKHVTDVPIFLDTKKILGSWANNVTFIKINYSEYKNNSHVFYKNDQLKNKTIITRGPHGCEYRGKIYPTKQVPVKDVSGAGDTFLAGLVVEFIKSNDIISAINFAQECTTIVVQKPGVSTI